MTPTEHVPRPATQSARVIASALALIVSLGAGVAHAIDIPKRKSGLWEMTITSSRGEGAHAIQHCIDKTADDVASPQGPRASPAEVQCDKRDIRKDGDKLVIDTVCKHAGTTITTHALVSGSFDSSYRMDSTSTFDPPMREMKESRTTVEAKWLGPCKPDQKPGDMIIPGMGKFNAQDMRERTQKTPKPQ